MSNPMYTHSTGVPVGHTRGTSAAVQAEFDLIEDGFDLAAPLASPALTGTPTAPTQTAGNNSTRLSTTEFVQAAIATVNAQTATTVSVVSGTSQTAVAGSHYVLTNVAATTVTLPASPASADTVWVTVANGLATNSFARNGKTIMGLSEDMTINHRYATVALRYVDSSWRIV